MRVEEVRALKDFR